MEIDACLGDLVTMPHTEPSSHHASLGLSYKWPMTNIKDSQTYQTMKSITMRTKNYVNYFTTLNFHALRRMWSKYHYECFLTNNTIHVQQGNLFPTRDALHKAILCHSYHKNADKNICEENFNATSTCRSLENQI